MYDAQLGRGCGALPCFLACPSTCPLPTMKNTQRLFILSHGGLGSSSPSHCPLHHHTPAPSPSEDLSVFTMQQSQTGLSWPHFSQQASKQVEMAALAPQPSSHPFLEQVTSGKAIVLVSAAAGNRSSKRPPLPAPWCGRDWKETGRNWWVGIRAV